MKRIRQIIVICFPKKPSGFLIRRCYSERKYLSHGQQFEWSAIGQSSSGLLVNRSCVDLSAECIRIQLNRDAGFLTVARMHATAGGSRDVDSSGSTAWNRRFCTHSTAGRPRDLHLNLL